MALGAAVAVGAVVGGVQGAVLGLVAGAVAERQVRHGAGGGDREDAAAVHDLPVACDLLAVCLGAGVPPGAALSAVAGAVPEPLRTWLRRVAGQYRLGAEPARAWAGVPPVLHGLARALVRAGESGSTVVPALRAVAADTRAAARGRVDAAVRRAGVWVLAPLGACFLPAFLCLGVVPLVLGIARTVFG